MDIKDELEFYQPKAIHLFNECVEMILVEFQKTEIQNYRNRNVKKN